TPMLDSFLRSNLPFPVRRGKVRDVYDLGEHLLIVASDRISAFDVIMPNGIPDKGKILTALSLFWFEKFGRQFEHHLIAARVSDYPKDLQKFADQLRGRSMLVKKAQVVPIECVARGYLAGSGWKEYARSQTVCGVPLPPGLHQSSVLPAPIFTPATKEEHGHDINIPFEEMAARVGHAVAQSLKDKTLALYASAANYARTRGIIIADTKFEFGQLPDGRLILIDEVLTPDSSRFWPADDYEPGHDQSSYDKQFVRNYLEAQPWDKKAPAPQLPPEVVMGTREKYLQAYKKLTGRDLNLD
ncbi:MAG TPA: phosphoribosylaminoimidazolesuccinocarboxamide synthase, partial [Tepidisphaeraceae bacterium]|nr:phosphoribosylaminoimidazolesuccinocarboxamide synthase [Tepidisphaeraceae bacterium]